MTDVDLFGNPDPPPRKGDIGYLTWIAEALQIEKPEIIPDDQLSLLDYLAEASP